MIVIGSVPSMVMHESNIPLGNGKEKHDTEGLQSVLLRSEVALIIDRNSFPLPYTCAPCWLNVGGYVIGYWSLVTV